MSASHLHNWPSIGFFAIVSSHTLLIALLCWGWQKPALDEAFEIMTRRELGGTAVDFSTNDTRLLERVWVNHPGFGRALLGKGSAKFLEPTESGWLTRTSVHLAVRTEPEAPTQFSLEGRGAPGDFPIKVRIFGKGLQRQVELLPNQPQLIQWSPGELKQPAILDVEVTASHSRSVAAPTWAIHIVSSSAGPAREAP